jgi:probable HAF family extracellular repeat protein
MEKDRMRKRIIRTLIVGIACLYLMGATALASAAPQYALTDVGTFGGPQAFINLPGVPITSDGAVLGTADTTIVDNDFPNFNPFVVGSPDPVLPHAFAWQDGRLEDLGALPGNNASAVFQVNGSGVGAGLSETGPLDPLTGHPAEHAVLFKSGRVIDLGTLPGGHETQATAINDRGQVAGFGNNGVADPVSFFPWGTETRSFIWQRGVMRDIGTLGGPDALMTELNARGEIAGDSYTNGTPNPATGAPTTDPFLWRHGHMLDLGTLGGTLSITNWLNDRGEVVGQSNLAGDHSSRPYLWDGKQLRDLGTLGGDFGAADYINEAGDVVGFTTTPGDNTAHAFLWKHGVMTDLTGARSTQCTFAEAINARDQIVGGKCDSTAALAWIDGRQYDLTTLVSPSDIQLTEAVFISDRGQIVALGVLPTGDQHLFVLTPDHHDTSAASASSLNRRRVSENPTAGCLQRLRWLPDTRSMRLDHAAAPGDAMPFCAPDDRHISGVALP